ncbi:MAG TPA: class I SAM-dependent methyltransferase [Thermoanaerobaculia bacterium]|jgi:SAM-dependent methyltransferase|nr:class I SAM-dependent methyltransferase [Thermoanaerobaculia bacterium]
MASSLARRAFKPIYWLYYSALFGRRFPGARWLARRVDAWEAATGRGDAPAEKWAWEEGYRSGRWAFMRELDEAARYAVIAAFAQRLAPGGAVLDLGCGEGLLVDALRPLGYRKYFGIDLSEAAIAQAASRADASTTFLAADAEGEPPAGPWNVVVFNESVYYFRDPLATLRRYESVLAPGGAFVVSTFRSRRAEAVVRALLRRYRELEATTVSNAKGSWTVRVLTL